MVLQSLTISKHCKDFGGTGRLAYYVDEYDFWIGEETDYEKLESSGSKGSRLASKFLEGD